MHRHQHRRLDACSTCMQRLAQAADLYRGDLLSGFHIDSQPFEEWLTLEREHYHRLAMETLFHLADCHNQRGEYSQAQHYARRQVELEPWREEAHRQLMIALALSGQRSAALAQYEISRRTLLDELGVEPEEETRALNEQIRAGDLHASVVPTHNLPAQRTRFVGREAELAEIAEQLNSPDRRLLTLVGSGGVGKTRLALAAARQVQPHFAGGTWFVPMNDVDEEPLEDLHDRMATTIARAIKITFSGQDDPKIDVLNFLRTRECLIILDNMEHLTSGANLVLDILQQCPKATILVTSRIRINARAERLVQISGLNVPQQADDPDLGHYSSVELFVDRATRPLTSSPDELAQIVQVCQLVEGVPLAIELASALVEHLPLEEIIANLRRDLGFLSTTYQDVPERHRQLRAVFEGSWQLLSATEQRALVQLSVFRGDFDRAAILAVTGTQQAELIGLTHKSLIKQSDPGRYMLHALVRQFASEKLASFPDLAAVRDRHSDYFLAFVIERTAALHGDTPQSAVAEIQTEIANVRQAWQRTMSQVDALLDPVRHTAALGRHAKGIARFLSLTGLFRAGERAFRGAARRVRTFSQEDKSLSPEDSAAVLQALARLLAVQGRFLVSLGDHSSAETVFLEADAVFKRAATSIPFSDTDLAERALLLAELGTACNRGGNYVLALQYLEEALTLARQVNDAQAEISARSTLGQIASEQGDYDTAKQHLVEVLALARACDDRSQIALVVSTLGSIAWKWGDFEQAERFLQEGLAFYRELGNKRRIPRILNALGILAILQERYDQAEAYWEEGLVLIQDVGDRMAMADALNNLGYINHHHLGDLEKARRYYSQSLDIDQEIGHRHGTTSTSSNMGHLHVLLGEYTPAWDCLRLALSESVAIGVAPLTLDALVGVAQLRAETGQGSTAAELLSVILNHPSVETDSSQAAERVLASLRETLSEAQLEEAMQVGKTLELEAVVSELLAE